MVRPRIQVLTDAKPLAITARCVEQSNRPACANTSRLSTDSGNQIAP